MAKWPTDQVSINTAMHTARGLQSWWALFGLRAQDDRLEEGDAFLNAFVGEHENANLGARERPAMTNNRMDLRK